jgi:hypothetical protein
VQIVDLDAPESHGIFILFDLCFQLLDGPFGLAGCFFYLDLLIGQSFDLFSHKLIFFLHIFSKVAACDIGILIAFKLGFSLLMIFLQEEELAFEMSDIFEELIEHGLYFQNLLLIL